MNQPSQTECGPVSDHRAAGTTETDDRPTKKAVNQEFSTAPATAKSADGSRGCSACGATFQPPHAIPGARLCPTCYAARKEALRVLPATANGRWREIHIGLGIGPEYLTGKHGPCPGCGGTDRFRSDNKDGRGTWICGGGGERQAGDGFALLSHVNGWSASESYLAVARWFGVPDLDGTAPTPAPRPAPEPVAATPKRSTANYVRDLWPAAERSDAVVGSHPYALSKGINHAAGAGRGIVTGRVVGTEVDCVLIPIRDLRTDAVVAVQAINAAGAKQTFGPVKGSAFICGITLNRRIPWYVCEGWADAVSLVFHRHKGNAAAFGVMGSHFDAVVQAVVQHFAPERLCIVGDAT